MAERPLKSGAGVVQAPRAVTRPPAEQPLPYPDRAARHWIISSIVWLTIVDLGGLVLSTEFVSPEAFGGISWLSFSRVRQEHVNGVILAWLTMMYFGAIFYILPPLCGTGGVGSGGAGVGVPGAGTACTRSE